MTTLYFVLFRRLADINVNMVSSTIHSLFIQYRRSVLLVNNNTVMTPSENKTITKQILSRIYVVYLAWPYSGY